MFWVVFHFISRAMLLIGDLFWWSRVAPLVPRRSWRVALGVFMSLQSIALFSLMCGSDWPRHFPTFFLITVTTWHYMALPVALGILIAWKIRKSRHLTPAQWLSKPATSLFPHTSFSLRELWSPDVAERETEGGRRLAPVKNPEKIDATFLPMSRREFFRAGAVWAPALFNVSLAGVALSEAAGFRVRRFTLPVAGLPKALDGMTIAQVSDIHIGRITRGRILQKIVDTTNDLRADMVVMTGDLIDWDFADLDTGIGLVRAMEGRYGLWMVEGNHDLYMDAEGFRHRVRAAGIPLLRDESAVATIRGCPVQLYGLSWFRGPEFDRPHYTSMSMGRMMEQRHPDAFPILLAHHPHAFDEAISRGIPLTLSGHTHGGYWMLDQEHGIGSAFFKYWSGLYTRGNSQLIVSNGVGNWGLLPPIRVNAQAEIVHVTLKTVERV
ncbi:MAG TPA: metallophosphoesterase [Desulfuromonadaceae bacterium]|nr:metallophosphoesterase [Desulfuromonadaceae bacterium]